MEFDTAELGPWPEGLLAEVVPRSLSKICIESDSPKDVDCRSPEPLVLLEDARSDAVESFDTRERVDPLGE